MGSSRWPTGEIVTTIDDEIKMNVEFDEIDMVKQSQDWVSPDTMKSESSEMGY